MISLGQCWELACRWYPGRDEAHWTRPDAAESTAIFREVGLTGRFWSLS